MIGGDRSKYSNVEASILLMDSEGPPWEVPLF